MELVGRDPPRVDNTAGKIMGNLKAPLGKGEREEVDAYRKQRQHL
jgi:hypothetical protein